MVSDFALASLVADDNWYMDLGATYHFTPDLDIMDLAKPFTGVDQVGIVGNGKKISISYIRHASIPAYPRPLSLTRIYQTLISNNLIGISKLYHDNKAFVGFHVDHFLVKN